MKVAIIVSYDGSKFFGSQSQSNKSGVADKIYPIFNSLGINSKLEFSGRTDAGVHASGQCISFLLPIHWQNQILKLKEQANILLQPDIFIKKIFIVDDNFHARFSAKKRLYRYFISTNEFDVFRANYICHTDSFDIKQAQAALKCFEGRHDFKSFCKTGSEPKTTIRTIYKTNVYSPSKNLFVVTFEANSFLRSQIRMMMWFVLQISKNKRSLEQLEKQLKNQSVFEKNLAPSAGLYLAKIKY